MRHPVPVDNVLTLAIDCGGSGLKGSVLNHEGAMVADRVRVPTPYPMSPADFVRTLVEQALRLPAASRATIGMPGMIRHGRVITTPHYITTAGPFSPVDPDLARAWDHFDAQTALARGLGIPTRVVNDAEVHGAAVVSGAGLEVVFTLGTGLGCAVFDDGTLVPKIELSRAPVRKGVIYDAWVGNLARRDLGNRKWSKRVKSVIDDLRPMFVWDRLYVGGGNARKLSVNLGEDVTVVPNEAGISGGIRLWELDHGTVSHPHDEPSDGRE
jgi:polyphosphate glucokinase